MTRRIKILQLHPDYNVKRYDFADLGEQILHSLPSDHFETVSGYLRGRPGPDQPGSIASRSVYFEFADSDLKGLRIKAMRRLYRYCKAERFDVIICNRFKPLHMMMIINKWLRAPLCIGIAHSIGEYTRSYRRWGVKRCIDERWRMVGVSPAVKRYLLDCNCGFTEHNTAAIVNAIDVAQAESLQYPAEEARRQLGLPVGPARVIGTIGRLVPVKGHRFLIEAFARLAPHFPDIHLAIIGGGREETRLREQIGHLGLEDRVHLPGALPDALRYVRAFDIWAMPSLREGMALSLLEGMSAHLPVVASDIEALNPILVGTDSARVPPGDVEALTEALATYLQMPASQLEQKGEQAFSYLIQHHDIHAFRQRYRHLITDSLRENTEP